MLHANVLYILSSTFLVSYFILYSINDNRDSIIPFSYFDELISSLYLLFKFRLQNGLFVKMLNKL